MAINNQISSSLPAATEVPKLDPLTGFHQQSYLNDVLSKTVKESQEKELVASLALLQLENFYEIKTWLGKSEATLFLSDMARLIKKSLPKTALLCRCERNEFAALLFDQSSQDSKAMAGRVQDVIETGAKQFLPAKLRLKIAIGIAAIDKRTNGIDVMYARARHNMHGMEGGAKAQFSHAFNLEPQALFVRVKAALKAGKIQPSFQAIVSLKSEHLRHYEIRTHIQDEQGVIPASLLFEMAVQYAWSDSLDRWLIRNALKILQQAGHGDMKLVINLSQGSIVSPSFFPWLQTQLDQVPSVCGKLVFQISEIDILITQHHISHFCRQLENLEIQLCINHFGCTDNPFRYLDLVRAEFVKLDSASLHKTMIASDKSRNLEELVEKLHDNGLRVIVSKVETVNEMPKLWRSNVSYVQGFGLHQPSKTLNYEFLQESTLQLH